MTKIYVVAATQFEIIPTIQFLDSNFNKRSFFEYEKNGVSVFPVVTGVGSMMTAFAISRIKDISSATLMVNAGVAGSFVPSWELGKVVEVVEDRFADLGVEEADGSFTDVFDLELIENAQFPFENGCIKIEDQTQLENARGITVNKVHGSAATINAIKAKYNPQIESMEGAAFMYAAKVMNIPALQLRSISNQVEPRNKDKWNLELAINNLNNAVIKLLNHQI